MLHTVQKTVKTKARKQSPKAKSPKLSTLGVLVLTTTTEICVAITSTIATSISFFIVNITVTMIILTVPICSHIPCQYYYLLHSISG